MKSNQFEVNEVELIYTPKMYQGEFTKVTDALSAALVFRQAYNPNTINFQEECIVMYLNNSNNIICLNKLSRGGITSTVVDFRLIMAVALKCFATGIILSHNHPSGKTKPSDSDIKLTRDLKEIGRLLNIPLLDHIILVPGYGYYSFLEEGML